jgi:hypothetical protein
MPLKEMERDSRDRRRGTGGERRKAKEAMPSGKKT